MVVLKKINFNIYRDYNIFANIVDIFLGYSGNTG